MSMTIAVTRNVPARFHGFLASCMLEVAPGVYAFPSMRKAIRDRLWNVLVDWSELIPTDGGVALFWRERDAPSGMAMRMIGWPKKQLVEHEGVWLTVEDLTQAYDVDELKAIAEERENDGGSEDSSRDPLSSEHL